MKTMKTIFTFSFLCLCSCYLQAQYLPEDESPKEPFKEDITIRLDNINIPDQAEVQRIVGIVIEKTKKTLSEKDNAAFQRLESQIRDKSNADLHGLAQSYMLKRYAAATAYIYAKALQLQPNDTLGYANLAICIKQIGQMKGAYILLLYAKSLNPQDLSVETNLGWVATALGDFNSANRHFERCLVLNPKAYSAYMGFYEIATARGFRQQALGYLYKALSLNAKSIGAIRRHQEEIQQKFDAIIEEEGSTETPPTRSVDEVLPIQVYEEGRAFPNLGVNPFKGQDTPPVFSSILENCMSNKRVFDWLQSPEQEGVEEIMQQVDNGTDNAITNEEATALIERLPPAIDYGKMVSDAYEKIRKYEQKWVEKSEPREVANRLVFPYPYLKELAALQYYEKLFTQRFLMHRSRFSKADRQGIFATASTLKAPQKEYEAKSKACGEDSDCQEAVRNKYCQIVIGTLKRQHSDFYAAWNVHFTNTRKDIKEYIRLSNPYISDIADPDLHKLVNLRRNEVCRQANLNAMEFALWQAHVSYATAIYCEPDFREDYLSEARETLDAAELDDFDALQGNCAMPTWNFEVMGLESQADCEKLSYEFGEGVIIGFEVKWGKEWGDDEIELFWGFKGEAQLGASLEAKAAAFMTFKPQKNNLIKMVDAGVKGEASAAIIAKMGGIGVKAQKKVQATIISLRQPKPVEISQQPEWKLTVD